MDNLKKLHNILTDNSYPEPLLNKLLFSNPSITPITENTNTAVMQPTISNAVISQSAQHTTYRSLSHVKNLTNQVIGLFRSEEVTVKIAKKSVFTITIFSLN